MNPKKDPGSCASCWGPLDEATVGYLTCSKCRARSLQRAFERKFQKLMAAEGGPLLGRGISTKIGWCECGLPMPKTCNRRWCFKCASTRALVKRAKLKICKSCGDQFHQRCGRQLFCCEQCRIPRCTACNCKLYSFEAVKAGKCGRCASLETTSSLQGPQLCWTCMDPFVPYASEWKCSRCIIATTRPGEIVNHGYFARKRDQPLTGAKNRRPRAGELTAAIERLLMVRPAAYRWMQETVLRDEGTREWKVAYALRSTAGLPATDAELRAWSRWHGIPTAMRLCFCLRPFVVRSNEKYCSSACASRAVEARSLKVDVALYVAAKALKAEAYGRLVGQFGVRKKRNYRKGVSSEGVAKLS
jgi:hypothetical protein